MATMTTMNNFLDIIPRLRSDGHRGLASSAIAHYERLIAGMPVEEHWRVSDMLDEVLETALVRQESITSEDILMRPDFAPVQALALLLLELNLVEEEVDLSDTP